MSKIITKYKAVLNKKQLKSEKIKPPFIFGLIGILIINIFLTSFVVKKTQPADAASFLSPSYDDEFWGPNSTAFASVIGPDGNIYVGGAFSRVQSTAAFGVPLVDATTLPAAYDKFNGQVNDAVPDEAGGFYVIGNFTKVGDYNIKYLAHLDSNYSVDPDFNFLFTDAGTPTLDAVSYNSTTNQLYVGGNFDTVNGETHANFVVIDTETKEVDDWQLAQVFNAPPLAITYNNDSIFLNQGSRLLRLSLVDGTEISFWESNAEGGSGYYELKVRGTELYVGGHFTTIDGLPRSSLAAIDLTTNELTDWVPNIFKDGGIQDVIALELVGDILYVGGDFDSAEGEDRFDAAAFDLSNEGVITDWSPEWNFWGDSPGTFYDLQYLDGVIYGAGSIQTVCGAVDCFGLLAVDAVTGAETDWLPNASPMYVSVIAKNDTVNADTVFVGGSFSRILNIGDERIGLAAFDPDTGLPTDFNMPLTRDLDFTPIIYSMIVDGNILYVGGLFDSIDGVARNNLAAIDLTLGEVTDWAPEPNGAVRALVKNGTDVFVGGEFTAIGGAERDNLAAVDSTTGLTTVFNAQPDGPVYSILPLEFLDGLKIYVGGSFSNIVTEWGTVAISSLARIDTYQDYEEGAVSEVPNFDIDGPVYVIACRGICGSEFYAGGFFTQVDEFEFDNLFSFSDTGVVNENFIPNPNGTVYSVLEDDSFSDLGVLVGGNFWQVDGQNTSGGIAGVNWADGGFSWRGGDLPQGIVFSMVSIGDTLYASGWSYRKNLMVHSWMDTGDNPQIDSLDPSSVTIGAEETTVIINGSGFDSNTSVRFGGQERLATLVSDTVLTVRLWASDLDVAGEFNIDLVRVENNGSVFSGPSIFTVEEEEEPPPEPEPGVVNIPVTATWRPNGPVFSVLAGPDDTVYVGGNFTRFGKNYGSAIPVDISTGLPNVTNPDQVTGTIYAVASDGSGGWFVGGSFTEIGGVAKTNLAHINSDGTVDADWTANGIYAPSAVYALVLSDGEIVMGGEDFLTTCDSATCQDGQVISVTGTVYALNFNDPILYIGGDFTEINGVLVNNLAFIGGGEGIDVEAFSSEPNGPVYALDSSAEYLFLGGDFTNIGLEAIENLAMFDIAGESPTITPYSFSFNGPVYSVLIGDGLYVGGDFTEIDDESRNYIASFGNDGLLTDWDPGANGIVRALTASGTNVYAGGEFTAIGGATRDKFASIDSTTGEATGSDQNLSTSIYALSHDGTNIYVGGEEIGFVNERTTSETINFPIVNGAVYTTVSDGSDGWFIGGNFTQVGTSAKQYLAHINSDGTVDDDWTVDNVDVVNTPVHSLLVVDANLFFGSENGVGQVGFANGGGDDSGLLSTNGTVYSIVSNGSFLYFGGDFTEADGEETLYLQILNLGNDDPVAWSLDNAPNGPVYTLDAVGNNLFVGGAFTEIGETGRSYFAMFDITDETESLSPVAVSLNGAIRSMVFADTNLYVAGDFTEAGGEARNYLAAFNQSAELLDWDPNANNIVYSLETDGTALYVAGDFTEAGGEDRNYIAAIDLDTGDATSWDPNASDTIYSTAISGDTYIYLGGAFTSLGSGNWLVRNNLAALNPSTGEPLSSWNPSVENGGIYSMSVDDTNLYFGGSFTEVDDVTRSYIASVDLSSGELTDWNPDADNQIQVITASDDYIYVGGDFTEIGGESRSYIAALNKTTGSATSWNPDADNIILGLLVSDDGQSIYAGGYFTEIGGVSRQYFASLDIDTGLVTNLDADPVVSGVITEFFEDPDVAIYAMGVDVFDMINLTTGENTHLLNPEADGNFYAFAQDETLNSFFGGEYTDFKMQGDIFFDNFAVAPVNPDDEASWEIDPNGAVYSIATIGDTVYVGGAYTEISSVSRPYFAQYGAYTGDYAEGGNPVPTLSSVYPSYKKVNSRTSTILVTGTDFIDGSTVYFGNTALTTTYISSTSLTATLPSSVISVVGSFDITVVTDAPGGGTSDPVTFSVLSQGSNVPFTNFTQTPYNTPGPDVNPVLKLTKQVAIIPASQVEAASEASELGYAGIASAAMFGTHFDTFKPNEIRAINIALVFSLITLVASIFFVHRKTKHHNGFLGYFKLIPHLIFRSKKNSFSHLTTNTPLAYGLGVEHHGNIATLAKASLVGTVVVGFIKAFTVAVILTSLVPSNIYIKSADLTFTSGGTKIKQGDVLTYRLTVTNSGGNPANQVKIRDIIPKGTQFIPNSVVINEIPSTLAPNTDGSLAVTFDRILPDSTYELPETVGRVQFSVKVSDCSGSSSVSNTAEVSATEFTQALSSNKVTNSLNRCK